jgi:hypothetical protein
MERKTGARTKAAATRMADATPASREIESLA